MSILTLKTIHPFPARMAPEIAMRHLEAISSDSFILDPMVGSGTTLKIAGMKGCRSLGFDVDPLALLIARVWNYPVDTKQVQSFAEDLIHQAQALLESPSLDWIDGNKETLDFVRFWFAKAQEMDLRKLAYFINKVKGEEGDVLRVALSRIIITKRRGASLGRDISHSRPHKVAGQNDFQVFPEFEKSVSLVCKALEANPGSGLATVLHGDAKRMKDVADQSIDYIMTSPPYFTAVDYFRGHRLALVWLGYSLATLRELRGKSIGLDRFPESLPSEILVREFFREVPNIKNLKPEVQGALFRYTIDLYGLAKEFHRVLKVGGKATVVLADSFSSGLLVSNTRIFKNVARMAGLFFEEAELRPILAMKRYLPPPSNAIANNLDKRMKTEAIMTFIRS